jgi:hypothetical protein
VSTRFEGWLGLLDTRRWVDPEALQQLAVLLRERARELEAPIFTLQIHPVNLLQKLTAPGPPLSALALGEALQQEREPAEQHLAADPIRQPIVERPQLQHRLQRAERPLHVGELLVAERHVLRGEARVRDRQQVLAVEILLLGHLRCIVPQLAVLQLLHVATDFPAQVRE